MPKPGQAEEAASVPYQPRRSGLSSPATPTYPVSPAKAPGQSPAYFLGGVSLCLLYRSRAWGRQHSPRTGLHV